MSLFDSHTIDFLRECRANLERETGVALKQLSKALIELEAKKENRTSSDNRMLG